jgi:hypothetical protein
VQWWLQTVLSLFVLWLTMLLLGAAGMPAGTSGALPELQCTAWVSATPPASAQTTLWHIEISQRSWQDISVGCMLLQVVCQGAQL